MSATCVLSSTRLQNRVIPIFIVDMLSNEVNKVGELKEHIANAIGNLRLSLEEH